MTTRSYLLPCALFLLTLLWAPLSLSTNRTSTTTLDQNRLNASNVQEDAWVLEMIDSKDARCTIKYIVKKGKNTRKQKQENSPLYDELMKYSSIKNFIDKAPDGKFESIFRLSRSKSKPKNIIVGVIDKECKLYLFSVDHCKEQPLDLKEEHVLSKIGGAFVIEKEIEENKLGELELCFNGEPEGDLSIIYASYEEERITIKDYVLLLPTKLHYDRDLIIGIIIGMGIALCAVFLYVICYKYWWLPRKNSL